MAVRTRKTPDDRREQIIAAAVETLADVGIHRLTAARVAVAARCSASLVKHYYPTMDQLVRAVMRHAVDIERADVLAQGLSIQHPVAMDAPARLKDRAAEWIAGGAL